MSKILRVNQWKHLHSYGNDIEFTPRVVIVATVQPATPFNTPKMVVNATGDHKC